MDIDFAPLQGYTENPYRLAHFEYVGGVSAYYTPFLRVEKGAVRSKDSRDLPRQCELPGGMVLVPQVIAKDVVEFNLLVDFVLAQGYKRIDINMGCPFPMQVNAGRGAGLLQSKDRVLEILDCVNRRAQEDSLEFSVKMRLGQESCKESMAILQALNSSKIMQVTLHPRLGVQQYKGLVDMEGFRAFYEACEKPLLFNGDIWTADRIADLENRFPRLSGIMVGRGLLARPSLAVEYVSGKAWPLEDRIALALKMHGKILDFALKNLQGENQALMKLKPFWEFQEQIVPKKIFKGIMKSGNLKNYLSAVESLA